MTTTHTWPGDRRPARPWLADLAPTRSPTRSRPRPAGDPARAGPAAADAGRPGGRTGPRSSSLAGGDRHRGPPRSTRVANRHEPELVHARPHWAPDRRGGSSTRPARADAGQRRIMARRGA
ncbi:hypothetical protein HBB16_14925 [Pseudonocardia sp. MCCB 268]|nr:hypothetical protein [Pseudonocardia cytotoxica]